MNSVAGKCIWSIGHSNRSIEHFIEILHSFAIETLVDIRSLPASKYCPQFNKDDLAASLARTKITYVHLPQLGGHQAGGFKAYMSTNEFVGAIAQLDEIAHKGRSAYMCAEADWKNCHRSLISAHLYTAGWEVIHMKETGECEPHRPLLKQSKLF